VDDETATIRLSARVSAVILAIGAYALFAPHAALASCTRPPAAPPLCIVGTITAKNNSSVLVETPGVTGSDWLHAGETERGWTIAEIGAGYVLVKNGDRTVRLEPASETGVEVAAPVVPLAVADRSPSRGPRKGPLRNPNPLQHRGEREEKD
jgi:hypothetical protein